MSELNEHLQRLLRSVSAGADPGRLLNEVLAGAIAASRGSHGVLMGLVDGVPTPLASSGSPTTVLLEAAEAAIATSRLARKTAGGSSKGAAAAEPIRVGDRIVGALAVSGEAFSIDLSALPLFASTAAIVLGQRGSSTSSDPTEVYDALAAVYAEPDQASVLVHLFDAAERLFAAQGGFCAVFEGTDAVRIAHHRGIDRERLREASRHPEFATMLNSPALRIDDADHPVVARLTDGTETAVGIPLRALGKRLGYMFLLLGDAPDAGTRNLLTSFGRHGALALRTSDLYRAVGDTEEQLASVVHSIPNPMLVVDDDGRFSLINGAAAEAFQISETFEVGNPAAGRLGHRTLEALLLGESDGQMEVALGSPAPRVYRATVRRVLAPGGRALGRVLVLDDVTAERETEQIKSDFIAVIGHELRTPLTVMKASARSLERNGATMDDAARTRAVGTLTNGVGRLERLVDDLLLVSSVEQNSAKLHAEPTDPGALVDEFHGERVVVRRPRRLEVIELDASKIRQVLHHLVDNALKFSTDTVTIEVAEHDDELEIVVDDKGPGIFSGDIPFLFERFRQLDGSSTRSHGGTGLGLYICRRLVETHGGRIWCESRMEIGSRFIIRLPRTVSASPPLRVDLSDESTQDPRLA